MDDGTPPVSHLFDASNGGTKRKRSPSVEGPPPPTHPAKTAKVQSSHLQINYLARQYPDTLPLISIEDSLPGTLQLLSDYGGVLERHESLAGNLGAKPLGPMLIKRFERLFDGPPRVLKTNGKEGTMVTWLDVVEFARHKPEQFNLEKMRDGVRVCQFYTKQSRVEISEEDFFLISSGMPQKLIPPQPIAEDEEKELGTLEIVEKNISQVIQAADQVSARARQLKHRLTARRNAIVTRREAEALTTSDIVPTATSDITAAQESNRSSSISPISGFVAVNSGRPSFKDVGLPNGSAVSNGKSLAATTASPSTKAELLSCFNIQRDRQGDLTAMTDYAPVSSARSQSSKSKSKQVNDTIDYASILLNSASPVPIPSTPSNLVHYPRPSPAERYEDSGPYKAEMLSRMDSMQRGDRVMPPCDRCRRLHMDCLKNLTACLGCTKKHAKCSWKEVTDQELLDNPHVPRTKEEISAAGGGEAAKSVTPIPDGPPQPVRDEELLGEESEDEDDKMPDAMPNSTDLPNEDVNIINKLSKMSTSPTVAPSIEHGPLRSETPGEQSTLELTTSGQDLDEPTEYLDPTSRANFDRRLDDIPTGNGSFGFAAVNHRVTQNTVAPTPPGWGPYPEIPKSEKTREKENKLPRLSDVSGGSLSYSVESHQSPSTHSNDIGYPSM